MSPKKNPFSDCHTITDLFMVTADLLENGENVVSSSGRPIGAQELAASLYVGIESALALYTDRRGNVDVHALDNALKRITQGKYGIRNQVIRVFNEEYAARPFSEQLPFVPLRFARRLMGPAIAQVADDNLQRYCRDNQMQPVLHDTAKHLAGSARSANEALAMVYEEAERFVTESGESPELILARAKQTIDFLHERSQIWPRVADELTNFLRRSQTTGEISMGFRMMTTEALAAYEQNKRGPKREVFERPETRRSAATQHLSLGTATGAGSGGERKRYAPPQPPAAGVDETRFIAVPPPAAPLRPAAAQSRGILSAPGAALAAVLAGGASMAAVCGGGAAMYSYSDSSQDTQSSAGDITVPDGWRMATPEEWALIEEHNQKVDAHQVLFAKELLRNMNTGLTRDGHESHNVADMVASFEVVCENKRDIYNFHRRFGNRVLVYEENETTVTKDDGEPEVDLPSVARMRHNNTPDDMSDDVMGYNAYWLEREQAGFLSSASHHEIGHKYAGGQGHNNGIADLNRWDDEYANAILENGDYAYFVSLTMDTADLVARWYIINIEKDIEEMQRQDPGSVTSDSVKALTAEYTIGPERAAAWSRAIAADFVEHSDVLNPLGVTEHGLAKALRAGRIHEVANERVQEYFAELGRELSEADLEVSREVSREEELLPTRQDARSTWR